MHDYDLTIESERVMWASIRDRLESGEEVPVEQLVWALDMDALDIDPDPAQQAFREEIRKQLSESASDTNADESGDQGE